MKRNEVVRSMVRLYMEINNAQENENCTYMTVGCKILDCCVFRMAPLFTIGGINNKLEDHQKGAPLMHCLTCIFIRENRGIFLSVVANQRTG